MSMDQKNIELPRNYTGFYAMQSERLQKLGIEINGLEVSHLAFRTATLPDYLATRRELEALCTANVENLWNGKPISKLLLQQPLQLAPGTTVPLIELLPPTSGRVHKTGWEHVGLVIGETFTDFGRTHAQKFTGQQDQGPYCQPYFITFPDQTSVKFYRVGMHEVCILEGRQFDGYHHEID